MGSCQSLTTAVEVELAKGDGRVYPEVVRITETILAYPGEVRLVLELADASHLVLEGTFGEIRVESLDDGVDLLALLGRHGRYGETLVGDYAVVLVCSAEMPTGENLSSPHLCTIDMLSGSTHLSSKGFHRSSGTPLLESIPSHT